MVTRTLHLLPLLLEEPSLVYDIIVRIVHSGEGTTRKGHRRSTETGRFTTPYAIGHDISQILCVPPRPVGCASRRLKLAEVTTRPVV